MIIQPPRFRRYLSLLYANVLILSMKKSLIRPHFYESYPCREVSELSEIKKAEPLHCRSYMLDSTSSSASSMV